MKVLTLILLIDLIFTNSVWSQQIDLTSEIEEYYQEMNFINAFSLREERQNILNLLTKGEDISCLKKERLCQIAEIIKRLREKALIPDDRMNARPAYPVQLLIPEINVLENWKMDNDHIQIWLNTFSIDLEDNLKFIASYTPEQLSRDSVQVDLSSLQYMSQEVHEWFFENDTWKKSSLNKILVR